MTAPVNEQRQLQQRAEVLARPRRAGAVRQSWRRVLEFRLLDRPFGVDLDRVEAIARIGHIYPVPLTPPHLQGIMRRHGQSLTLVSLRHFFDPGAQGVYDADYALIVHARDKRFALQAEDVSGVLQLAASEVRPAPENIDASVVPYLAGVTAEGVSILSLDHLVDAPHFAAGGEGPPSGQPKEQP